MATLSAIVPARDEAGRVGRTVRALLAVDGMREVVVVDDGSRDDTAREANEAGARVARRERPGGKAAAVRLGAGLAREDLLVLCDADLEGSARCAERLALPVAYGRAAMSVALLPPSGSRGGLGAAVGLARWGVRRLTGMTCVAPLCGQRVLWRCVLDCLGPAVGFGLEVALTVDAARAGYGILEVPTEMRHRVGHLDLPGWTHRGRQFSDVARSLAARWR